MRANISYILLYDLLVFKGARPCAIHLVVKNQNTQIHTGQLPSVFLAEGETRPEGCHIKATQMTPVHQEATRPHRTEWKLHQ